jgi:uncharacterized YigZ family protein
MSGGHQTHKTLAGPSGPFPLREKKSKFVGYAFPATTQQEVDGCLAALRKEHPGATHVCYAYRIGPAPGQVRTSDDGEPAYSAGAPILGKIESYGLTDVLVCVVRYYGGTKLGVGGLIQAYRGAADLALEGAVVLEVEPVEVLSLQFEYPQLDAVMRFIAQNQLELRSQRMALDCALDLAVPPADLDRVLEGLRSLGPMTIKRQGPRG